MRLTVIGIVVGSAFRNHLGFCSIVSTYSNVIQPNYTANKNCQSLCEDLPT